MKKRLQALLVVTFVLLLSVGLAQAAEKEVNLTWMAGSAGGGWYQMAAGISAIVKDADPGITIKVLPGGGTQNPPALAEKKVDIAFGLPFLNKAAIDGTTPYEKKYSELRLLACGYMSLNHLHLFAGEDTPYKTMDDVFGGKHKPRLATSQQGASEVYILERVLEVYGTSIDGLSNKGYHLARGNYSFQVSQFKDQNVDVVWSFYAAPTASVTEATIGRALRLIHFPEKVRNHLKQYGIEPCEIPAGAYPKAVNGNEAIKVSCNGSAILVHKDMPDDVAYRLAKAINGNVDKVHKVHAGMASYEPALGLQGSPGVPPHPGAVKYYKEKGWAK
jgi:TRAP transporter TAXI family solute receptor